MTEGLAVVVAPGLTACCWTVASTLLATAAAGVVETVLSSAGGPNATGAGLVVVFDFTSGRFIILMEGGSIDELVTRGSVVGAT